jgi:hypothetical protein
MFASARFNALISASGFENGEELKARKKDGFPTSFVGI